MKDFETLERIERRFGKSFCSFGGSSPFGMFSGGFQQAQPQAPMGLGATSQGTGSNTVNVPPQSQLNPWANIMGGLFGPGGPFGGPPQSANQGGGPTQVQQPQQRQVGPYGWGVGGATSAGPGGAGVSAVSSTVGGNPGVGEGGASVAGGGPTAAVGSGGAGGGAGACFLTTAVTKHDGKPDDCTELQTLRKFRDDVMLATPEGKELVNTYYKIAPSIVDKIDRHPESDSIYGKMRIYIDEAISAINAGDNDKALGIYTSLVGYAGSV